MAFLESRIDPKVERNAQVRMLNRGRTKVYVDSGALVQGFYWSAPLREYDVSHGLRTLDPAAQFDGFESIHSCWHVVNFTPYEGFRFKDWSDYRATMVTSHVLDLGGGSYQLMRRYTFGGINFDRIISKPNSDAVLRDAGGNALTATISTTTGIATGVSGGTPAKWTGTFDVPVTFLEKHLPLALENGALVVTQPIKLEEIRL